MPLHPQAQFLVEMAASLGQKPIEESSPSEARAMYDARRVPSTEHVHEMRDVTADGVPCRLYRPNDAQDLGLLVYFHGGGWVIGGIDSHDNVCRSLCNRANVAVLSVDYRLAPEHKFPAPLEDCVTALTWAHRNAASIGVDGNKIAVGGDSAGGNLAAVVAQLRPVPLKFQLLIYPVTDGLMSHGSYEENKNGPLLTRSGMTWFWNHYISGATKPDDPRVSPLFAKGGSIAGAPPALVITAEFDPLRDEARATHAFWQRTEFRRASRGTTDTSTASSQWSKFSTTRNRRTHRRADAVVEPASLSTVVGSETFNGCRNTP